MRARRIVREVNMPDAVLTVIDWVEQWHAVEHGMVQLDITITFRSRNCPDVLRARASVHVPREAAGAEHIAEKARMQLLAEALMPVLR